MNCLDCAFFENYVWFIIVCQEYTNKKIHTAYLKTKTMDFILKNIWFILFLLWGLPLSYYRSKFRKIVYQTDSWLINVKPYFWKELKGLFGNLYPDNLEYKKLRNFYLFYLFIYSLLFTAYLIFDKS